MRVHIEWDPETEQAEAERAVKRFRKPVAAPIFEAKDWMVDFPRTWLETSSPETRPGSNQSELAHVIAWKSAALNFWIGPEPDGQAGARALFDPTLLRAWTAFAPYYGRTVEFLNTWFFPADIPNYVGDNGFITAGWQFKADASDGARASMAMNLHAFRGEGMRWWLQGNTFETRAQDDSFPIIPVGVDVQTRLLVHFHEKDGWMELQYAGKSLKVTGANMQPDGTCGAYLCLYGTVDAAMIVKQTKISVIG